MLQLGHRLQHRSRGDGRLTGRRLPRWLGLLGRSAVCGGAPASWRDQVNGRVPEPGLSTDAASSQEPARLAGSRRRVLVVIHGVQRQRASDDGSEGRTAFVSSFTLRTVLALHYCNCCVRCSMLRHVPCHFLLHFCPINNLDQRMSARAPHGGSAARGMPMSSDAHCRPPPLSSAATSGTPDSRARHSRPANCHTESAPRAAWWTARRTRAAATAVSLTVALSFRGAEPRRRQDGPSCGAPQQEVSVSQSPFPAGLRAVHRLEIGIGLIPQHNQKQHPPEKGLSCATALRVPKENRSSVPGTANATAGAGSAAGILWMMTSKQG